MKSDIISIAMGELQVAFDNEVMKAVQKVDVDVDKEELLKALELHRNLVRCRECRHRNERCGMGEHRWCEILNMSTTPDDFCSYGEREGE